MKTKVDLIVNPFIVPLELGVTCTPRPAGSPAPPPRAVPSPGTPMLGTSMGVPLRDLDAETLSNLCHQFRRDVFACAGKREPNVPTAAPQVAETVRPAAARRIEDVEAEIEEDLGELEAELPSA